MSKADPTIKEVLESLQTAMVTDSRDWSSNKRDAWLYGVIVGWLPVPYKSFENLMSREDYQRMNKYHKVLETAAGKSKAFRKQAVCTNYMCNPPKTYCPECFAKM